MINLPDTQDLYQMYDITTIIKRKLRRSAGKKNYPIEISQPEASSIKLAFPFPSFPFHYLFFPFSIPTPLLHSTVRRRPNLNIGILDTAPQARGRNARVSRFAFMDRPHPDLTFSIHEHVELIKAEWTRAPIDLYTLMLASLPRSSFFPASIPPTTSLLTYLSRVQKKREKKKKKERGEKKTIIY